jgi:hypothetical protein
VRAGASCPVERERRARRGLSKLSSTNRVEFDIILGELETGRRIVPRTRLKSGTDISIKNGRVAHRS